MTRHMFARQYPDLPLNKPKPISIRLHLLSSGGFFLVSVITGLLLIMLLNEGIVNHVFTPLAQQLSLFSVLWNEKPLLASRFLLTKSVIVFAHQDPRSGLNLWTYEFNAVTILVYALVAIFAGRLLLNYFSAPHKYAKAFILGLCGCLLTLLSVSYMSVIEHCSGATWVGFVSLYGMGLSEFELYPLWQWLCAGLGCLALLGSGWLIFHRRQESL